MKTNLRDVSSLRLPFSSSSELVLLTARLLLAARDDGAEPGLEDAGEPFFDLALRDTVLPLSRACRRRSCMMKRHEGKLEVEVAIGEFFWASR